MPASLEDAIRLVLERFHLVTDKAGEPYILHCLRVMLAVSGNEARQVAVMHDLVEDTSVTLEDLKAMGFSEAVIEGVRCMTHVDADSYAEYVVRLKSNPLARAAKLADLRDNYSLDRVAYRGEHRDRDSRRLQRYILSFQFLSDQLDESHYRQQMAMLED